MRQEEIKKAVRNGYAKIAKNAGSCCAPAESCCGNNSVEIISREVGYSPEELMAVPEGANLGLGCGNPIALASLQEGETVIDLGSGAGFDCFLAAHKVGKSGRVIGVDMTPEMVKKAIKNARKDGYRNIEFRLGEIENLPVADSAADVIISNCVINLVLNKKRVFEEAFRVLKPGGRMMISDIVLLKPLPDFIMNSVAAYIGCISGAIMKDKYIDIIREVGFRDVRVMQETSFPMECMANDPTAQAIIRNLDMPREDVVEVLEGAICSINVQAIRP